MSNGRNTTVFSVRVSDDTLAALKAVAVRRGMGFTVVVRRLIERELEREGRYGSVISTQPSRLLTPYKNPRLQVKRRAKR